MKITAVNIEGERQLAVYNKGKLALLDDYGIKTGQVSLLSDNDLKKINDII